MAEIHLPANRLLLICKCRFWRFLKVDRVKSTFIDLLKKIDQIDQIDRIDQIDFYAVPDTTLLQERETTARRKEVNWNELTTEWPFGRKRRQG